MFSHTHKNWQQMLWVGRITCIFHNGCRQRSDQMWHHFTEEEKEPEEEVFPINTWTWSAIVIFLLTQCLVSGPTTRAKSVLLGLSHPWIPWLLRVYAMVSLSVESSRSGRSVSLCQTVHCGRSVEIQFFGQHGDHAGDLLLLTEAWVFRPRLKAGGHHVVDPCQDLHYLQLLAKLIEDIAERLDKPRSAARVPPRVITWKTTMLKLHVANLISRINSFGHAKCAYRGQWSRQRGNQLLQGSYVLD